MDEFGGVLFPVLAIEILDLDMFEGTGVDTAEVNADAVRVGTRDVERLNAAGFAEVMLRDAGIERITVE
jgi:hypothetical protein